MKLLPITGRKILEEELADVNFQNHKPNLGLKLPLQVLK
jgi:hypothetical protein